MPTAQKQRANARSRRCTAAWVTLLLACVICCGPPSWQGGIRAELGASERGVRVIRMPLDSPAAKAGLLQNDFILAIDDKPIAGLSGKQLHDLLTGEVGSPVRLRIARDGSEHEIAVTRAPYNTRDRYGKLQKP